MTRTDVQYWSPKWAGFEFRASYSANEGRTATLNPRSNGASLTWSQGPIYVGYAYHELMDQTFGTPVLQKQQANSIFGYFDFLSSVSAASTTRTSVRPHGPGSMMIPVTWTIGNNVLSYVHQDMKDGEVQTIATQPHCKVDIVGCSTTSPSARSSSRNT